jgi:UDP-N-acetylglucosamine--N-acetylmuramyl-(pentapeptide) pyrophosphoryl-undecaprenol N-acetylglucosamine transferase
MRRVIISGGGTGGHVFPAIAIANALKTSIKEIEILFIGAKGRMEMEKVPAAGFHIEGLTISGFQRRLTLKNLTFPFKLLGSLLKARTIISKFKPDVVIGVGGYASGPTLRIATARGIPSLIQEQNSFPGVTNRILGNRVQKICVAYEGMNKYFPAEKIVLTGNPIRQEVLKIVGKTEEALQYFGLNPGRKTILVIGGSLGAGTINQAILKFVNDFPDQGSFLKTPGVSNHNITDFQILWQTGKNYFDNINASFPRQKSYNQKAENSGQSQKSTVANRSKPETGTDNLVILPFIDRMDLAYAAADLIVSRAGAIAISELCVIGKPVILVPSPNVAEDHQTKNALFLVNRNAAILVRDFDAIEKLGITIIATLADVVLQSELKKNIAELGITDAAARIADEVLKLGKDNE